MTRRLTGIVAALCLAFGALFASVGPAAAFSSSCGNIYGTGTTMLMLFEHANFNDGWTFPAGPSYNVLCVKASSTGGVSISSMKNVAFQGVGGDTVCDGQLATSYGTWNDCVSSFQVQIDCHHSVSLYADANYGSLLYSFSASTTRSTLPFGYNDAISSLKITYHSVCQTSPA